MRSFPFDSDVTYDENGNPEYDRGADSTILSDFIHLMFTDGVFPNPSTGLQVTHSDETMSVIVLPGNCMIQGRMGIEEADRTLVFEASGTTYDRIDSVVARLNINHDYRDIDLYVVRGVEAGSPVPPELTRTGGVYELRLANVFIAKNTTVISSERITDTRLITDDCGIVTSNPKQVDTTSIFAQYQASLENYMRYVQECIDGTTAGNLQNQIDELDAKVDSVNSGLANLNTNLGKKAPTSHASTGTGYGVGSGSNYGHCKTINNLTASKYVNGESLSAYQGAVLKSYINVMCGGDGNTGQTGEALRLIGKSSTNCVYGNYNLGIYFVEGSEEGLPLTGYAGFLITLRWTTSRIVKILFLVNAYTYIMSQENDGTVVSSWTRLQNG